LDFPTDRLANFKVIALGTANIFLIFFTTKPFSGALEKYLALAAAGKDNRHLIAPFWLRYLVRATMPVSYKG